MAAVGVNCQRQNGSTIRLRAISNDASCKMKGVHTWDFTYGADPNVHQIITRQKAWCEIEACTRALIVHF